MLEVRLHDKTTAETIRRVDLCEIHGGDVKPEIDMT
jgi:hypothetical protein